ANGNHLGALVAALTQLARSGRFKRSPVILATTEGGQPWDRLESQLDVILSYLWKSRCRPHMSRSCHRLRKSRQPPLHQLGNQHPNPGGKAARMAAMAIITITTNQNQNELARTGRLISGMRTLTLAALAERVERAASAFASIGVERGDGVGLLLRNDFSFFE